MHCTPPTCRLSRVFLAALFWLTATAAAKTAISGSTPQIGTTVITHGFQILGTLPDWPETLASAIRTRAGGGRVFAYLPASGALDLLAGSLDEPGETILIFDWAEESNLNTPGFSEAAAEALLTALVEHSQGPSPLIPLSPLHLIGHSRGAVVNSEVAERLIANGIAVDHVTTLDPHDWGTAGFSTSAPVKTDWDVNAWHPGYPRYDGFGELPGIQTWEGIGFADNYYQESGSSESFTRLWGKFLPGAANLFYPDSFGIGHSAVHSWYHGTVDTAANSDGDGGQILDSWYDNPGGHTECNASAREWTLRRMTDGFWFGRLGGWTPSQCPEANYASGRSRVAVAFSYGLPEGLVNGDFERGISGWSFHGGNLGAGAAVGNGVLDLNLDSAGPAKATATHNRFYVPLNRTHLRLCRRVVDADPDDRFRVEVGAIEVLSQPVDQPSSKCEELVIEITPFQGSTQTLTLELAGQGAATARVFVDDIVFLPTDLMLRDGFESGDSSAWSNEVP